MIDKTGNGRKRPPVPPVTRSMADAGKAKLAEMMRLDTEEEMVSDDTLVAEVFIAMWLVMQEQAAHAQAMAAKGASADNILIMPRSSIIRPQ